MVIRTMPREVVPVALGPREPTSSHAPAAQETPRVQTARAWLDRLARDHYAFVWRTVRRLGIAEAEVDDVVQEVFLVAARHTGQLHNERGFLFRTSQFVCSHERRHLRHQREIADETALADAIDASENPEENLARSEQRDLLQELLDTLTPDQRAVFVLFELEQITTVEIAQMLDLPIGTVASRLRRAREVFTAAAAEKGLT